MSTTVINKIEKEFIFRFLIQNAVNFEIKMNNNSTFATLLEQNSKELKLDVIAVFPEMRQYEPEIEVFFYFQNNYHTFKSKILKIQNNTIIIVNPDLIAKNLQRKFKRVLIQDKLNLQFKIKGELIRLNYPISSVQYYPNVPPIEADFHDLNINTIIMKFNEKMKTLVSYNKIRMLRNNTINGFEEMLTIKYGKILYIQDINSELPQKQIIPNVQIILKPEWINYEILKNKTQPYLANNAMIAHLQSLAKNGIYSEAVVPVLYRNYVVALIYLVNDQSVAKPIDFKIINYTFQFSRLLSYVLKENNYFAEEEKNTEKYDLPIYDLSPGGLSFEYETDHLEDKLLLNHNFQFMIIINNKTIRISAKLVRKYKRNEKFCYGFMFIDIKKEDFDYLNKYLYTGKNNS